MLCVIDDDELIYYTPLFQIIPTIIKVLKDPENYQSIIKVLKDPENYQSSDAFFHRRLCLLLDLHDVVLWII